MSRGVFEPQTEGIYRINSETTRRKFLGGLAGATTSLAGLQLATERAFGENPKGKPLVWRYDRFGNPETIRYVPQERYRRIQVYENVNLHRFYERSDRVNGMTLKQRSDDPTDLALKIYADQNTRSVRHKLPNRFKEVPVIIEERKINRNWGRTCDRRILDFYDPLPANPGISTYDGDNNKISEGTLGVVCWNDDPNNAHECYITAAHVAENDGSYADYLRHAGVDDNGNSRSEDVGKYANHDSGMDVIKYRRRSGTVSPDIRGNADDHLGNLSGTWTHAGLTDRTSGSESLPVEFAGRSTCYATTECVSTSKSSLVEYQADYSPNEVTSGDSGGPFLDNDGYLVGTFSYYCESCEESHGPTGQELLDRLDAQRTNPELT